MKLLLYFYFIILQTVWNMMRAQDSASSTLRKIGEGEKNMQGRDKTYTPSRRSWHGRTWTVSPVPSQHDSFILLSAVLLDTTCPIRPSSSVVSRGNKEEKSPWEREKEKKEGWVRGGRGGPMDEEGRIWCPPTPESFSAKEEREEGWLSTPVLLNSDPFILSHGR